MFINVNENATEGFDNDYDAYKLKGIYEAPQIYSIIPSNILSINVLPEITENMVIPIGFEVGNFAEYTISVSGIDSFDKDLVIFLEDLIDNYTVNLSQNEVYSFTASPMDFPHRFNLYLITGILSQ